MRECKILFTGTMGAGKTTAIGAVSDIMPVTTEVKNHDTSVNKEFTTVGLDYGEVHLGGRERLRLYGTPGQARFSFMWKILAKGALGLVILVDNTSDRPIDELGIYLDSFRELIAETACVIGVSRVQVGGYPTLDDYSGYLAKRGLIAPVVAVDVRESEQVKLLLDLLLLQLECRVN